MYDKKEDVVKRVTKYKQNRKESGDIKQEFYLSNEYNEKFKGICSKLGKTKEKTVEYFIDNFKETE